MLLNYVRTVLALEMDKLNMDKRAVTAIEYGLIAALVAVAIIVAVTTMSNSLKNTFNLVGTEL